MGSYAPTAGAAPKTLTSHEQAMLLRVSGQHRDGFRDHVLFSMALGTGLRESELVALDVGDLLDPSTGTVKQRILLRTFKGSEERGGLQEVVLPDVLRLKLTKYLRWKRKDGEPVRRDSPLFLSRNQSRLSTRQVRYLFAQWQQRAGFERHLPFHALRHTACSALYRGSRDIRLTQRFARHASVVTTAIYAHPTDEDLVQAVRQLEC